MMSLRPGELVEVAQRVPGRESQVAAAGMPL